ncbi:unnamed protein product, partial [Mesorhabditis belari]|uniref:Uncharacterized protein n=1 Tax=Mesorhabditis belari TaxID=2138241 RepID=A0AAF3FP00_9BILA
MKTTIAFGALVVACLACTPGEYMTCVSQVLSQRVPFDYNVMSVALNITSEAMLLKTCRAYQNAIPCFEQRTALCGTRAQKQSLDKGKRIYSYLCAPFSLQRQKILLRRMPCIQEVVSKPIDGTCEKGNGLLAKKVASCRAKCPTTDTSCLAKVDLSDVAVCTVLELEKKCGIEGAQFYSQMQQVLINAEYPVQCRYSFAKSTDDLKKRGLPAEPLAAPAKSPAESSIEDRIRENMKKITTTTRRPPIRRQARIRTVFIKRPQPATIQLSHFAPPVVITKNRFSDVGASIGAQLGKQPGLLGARPIPDSIYMDQPTTSVSTPMIIRFSPPPTLITQKPFQAINTPAPKLFQWSAPKLSTMASDALKDFKVPAWYNQIKGNGNGTSTTLNPLFVYRPPAKDTPPANNAYPGANLGTTPLPFKISINWIDPETTVAPNRKITQPSPNIVRLNDDLVEKISENVDTEKRDDDDSTLPTIDLEDLSNKASRYFSAAVSAIEEKTTKHDGDAWSKIAGIVGPAIQKISPQVIVRLKEELDKIDVPTNDDAKTTTPLPVQAPAPQLAPST